MTESSPALRRETEAFEGAVAIEDASAAAPEGGRPSGRSRGRRRRPRRSWREGGSSVRRWGWELVGWSVLALGAGMLASAVAQTLVGGEAGSLLATVALWLALAVPVVLALRRSRPRGLLRVRGIDVVYALVLGVALRIVQGWLEVSAGGSGAWPSYPTLDGSLPPSWAFDQFVAAIVVAPVLEELFFRGLLLVALYSAVRRLSGRVAAGLAAGVVSTIAFVAAHAVAGPLAGHDLVALALVGASAAALVLTTGRVWPAVLLHVVYNGSWVALATVGTLLAG